MGDRVREYGSRYLETRNIKDLGVLAECMIVEMSRMVGVDNVPDGADFSIHVIANVLLDVYVGGLPDDFTFSYRPGRRLSADAQRLRRELGHIVESYGWINPADPTDRRFAHSVLLLAESGYRRCFWAPGVVRLTWENP